MRALRALANLLRLLLAPLWLLAHRLSRPKATWVVLRLESRVSEFRPRLGLVRRLLSRAPELRSSSLEDVRALVKELVEDPRMHGVLVYVPALDAAWATCESLRELLTTLRDSGKQLVCYLTEGGGNRELFVASCADRIYVAPFTAFGPLGLASRPLYIRRLLDKIGLEVEAQACGEYKSAAEPALRDTISEPAREQTEALIWAMHRALEAALRERRGLAEDRLAEIFARGLLRASEAKASGVIDEIVYEDELRERLGFPASDGEQKTRSKSHFVEPAAYLPWRRARLWQPLRAKPYVAVISLRGMIVGDRGGLSRPVIRHASLAATLRKVKRDPRVRAVVLAIDSPGGSALASELIHREVQRLARAKPVVGYFGDVAASGGYYIGCACQRIVAQALTITGSIGVISVKVAAASLLDRAGVSPQLLRTAPSADMLSFARPFSSDERAIMQAHADELYERFLTVVAEGRKLTLDEVARLARGRVWSGRDAHERGLVDALGGLDRAIEEARSLVPDSSKEARAALDWQLYHPKATPGGSTPEQAAAWLAEQFGALSELELIYAARREPLQLYAPFASGFEG